MTDAQPPNKMTLPQCLSTWKCVIRMFHRREHHRAVTLTRRIRAPAVTTRPDLRRLKPHRTSHNKSQLPQTTSMSSTASTETIPCGRSVSHKIQGLKNRHQGPDKQWDVPDHQFQEAHLKPALVWDRDPQTWSWTLTLTEMTSHHSHKKRERSTMRSTRLVREPVVSSKLCRW